MRDGAAYERFARAVELPMLVLALMFVPVLVVPMVFDVSAGTGATLKGVAWLIWAAFAVEYVALLWLAPDRWLMVRTHKLDLLIVVVPFLRPLRAARLVRLLRVGVVAGRASEGARRLLGRRGFSGFLALVGGAVVACGVGVWGFERGAEGAEIVTVADGLWWALVTATTVGYGDVVPVTAEGRGVAVALMLVGVALLSVVTANIAAFFVEESDAADRGELVEVRERLERIERLLLEVEERRSPH